VFAESLTSSIAASHFSTTKQMGYSPHGRLMIESSQYAPTIEVASRLRLAFGVSWDELMKGL
jgi:hypothetical protein